VDTQVDNGATTGDGGRQRAQGSNLPRDGVPAAGPDDNLRPAASNNQIPAYTPWNQNLEQAGVGSQARNQISFLENQQVIHDLIGRTASRPVDPRSTELRTELSNFESEESNRIRELGDEIDQYMLDLDDLEGEIPDRESIKKRIKTQTKLGLAQAFFNAAEKGSPDFITHLIARQPELMLPLQEGRVFLPNKAEGPLPQQLLEQIILRLIGLHMKSI